MADAHPRTRSHLARTWRAVRRLVASRSAVVGPRLVVALALVFAVAVLARTAVYGSVFRGDAVVLLSNDPYYYRFVVERHVAAGSDLGSLLRYDGRDPLFVVSLSVVVALLGGVDHAGAVLAWYPVVVGLLTVGLVFAFATLATGSRAVGVVAAAALALSPAHVARTALGFSDHHAADYLWLVATATLVVALARFARPGLRLALVPFLAVSLAAQVLSWEAGIALLAPTAVVVAILALVDAAAGRRPTVGIAAAAAFVVAAGLVAAATAFGWHDGRIAVSVAVLAGFVVGVVGVAALSVRAGVPARVALGPTLLLAALGVVAAGRVAEVASVLSAGRNYLAATAGSGVAETVSLVGGPLGPLTGPLSLFGVGLFVALPSLLGESRALRRAPDAGRLLLVTFTWVFLALALVQRRFAGELSPFVAVLVGIALVDLAWRAGVLDADPLARRRRRPVGAAASRLAPVAFALLVVVATVTSAGFLAIKLNQSVVSDAEYEAARAIHADAAARGLDYPHSYVLSSLGRNRLYNYEVSGHAAPALSYRYAAASYDPFLAAASPDERYWHLRDRVGYVVTTDGHRPSPASTGVVLHDRVGSDGDGVAGTGHFRLVYASDDGSVKAFALVPGAVVVGTADPGRSVAVSVPVTVDDRAITYARETTTTAAGWYAVTVPYPGRYTVDGRPVTVSERDVLAGRFVDADGRSPAPTRARWSFDAGRGDVAFDSHGGAHGRVVGPTWAAEGLDFRGTGGVTIAGVPTPTPETGLALTVRFAAVDSIDPSDPEPTRFPRLVAAAPSGRYTTTDGYQLGLVDGRIVGAVGDGPGAGVVRGPAVDDGRQHVVSLLWDGAVVRLVVDGDVVDAVPYDGPVTRSDTLVVGATTDDRYHLRGVVTDIRLDLAPDGAVRDGTTPTGAYTELPDPHPPLPLSTVSNTEPSYRGV